MLTFLLHAAACPLVSSPTAGFLVSLRCQNLAARHLNVILTLSDHRKQSIVSHDVCFPSFLPHCCTPSPCSCSQLYGY
jgi:hypothetical protein